MADTVNLQEYLHPKMDILFVALNAPKNSNHNRHWFSNNLSFYNLLYKAGIITDTIKDKLKGDEIVFGSTSINYNQWSIGVTDLQRQIVETKSNKVKLNLADVNRIISIMDTHKISKLCLMHSKVGKAFRKYASQVTFTNQKYGVIGSYNKTVIYEVPFHSGNSISNKERYYAQLIE